jgi:hypothetical protein
MFGAYCQIAAITLGKIGIGSEPIMEEPDESSFTQLKTYTPRAIKDQCADTITHPDLRTSNGSSILTRPSVGRS